MITKEITVTGSFHLTVDETKFTPEFMAEFNEHFFYCADVKDHIEHLAQLFGRGIIDGHEKFIEGYGDPKEFGIKFELTRGASAWADVSVEVDIYDPQVEPA